MAERHGVIMSCITDAGALNKLTTAIMSNTADFCQGAALGREDWAPAAANGFLLDMNTLDPLNLEASYWDQRIQKDH